MDDKQKSVARKDELGTCDYLAAPHIRNKCDIYTGCRDFKPIAPQASPEHDLRKQDTPESKEHWDFVAEATARVEAMPEWKKNSVAVGGSPEAPAKEDEAINEAAKAVMDLWTDRCLTFNVKTIAAVIRARLGLSGRDTK